MVALTLCPDDPDALGWPLWQQPRFSEPYRSNRVPIFILGNDGVGYLTWAEGRTVSRYSIGQGTQTVETYRSETPNTRITITAFGPATSAGILTQTLEGPVSFWNISNSTGVGVYETRLTESDSLRYARGDYYHYDTRITGCDLFYAQAERHFCSENPFRVNVTFWSDAETWAFNLPFDDEQDTEYPDNCNELEMVLCNMTANPLGTEIATMSWTKTKDTVLATSVRVWSLDHERERAKCIMSYPVEHRYTETLMGFSPDGRWFIMPRENSVILHDMQQRCDGQEYGIIANLPEDVEYIFWNENCDAFCSCSKKTVYYTNLLDPMEVSRIHEIPSYQRVMHINQDGLLIVQDKEDASMHEIRLSLPSLWYDSI